MYSNHKTATTTTTTLPLPPLPPHLPPPPTPQTKTAIPTAGGKETSNGCVPGPRV